MNQNVKTRKMIIRYYLKSKNFRLQYFNYFYLLDKLFVNYILLKYRKRGKFFKLMTAPGIFCHSVRQIEFFVAWSYYKIESK